VSLPTGVSITVPPGYYATFQAAIAALLEAGIVEYRSGRLWDHGYVQAEFVGRLVNRQKIYPAGLRQTLSRNREVRDRADYTDQRVSDVQANRALQRSRSFVSAVREELSKNDG
jgi:uncharacterized protein (UPF0332 family)